MKQFALLDFCYPDYFSGYNKPCLAVPVYDVMTNQDVIQAISEELNYYFNSLMYSKTEVLIIDEYINELSKEPFKQFINPGYEGEIEEPSYLYFSFIKPVYNNGIMFLN